MKNEKREYSIYDDTKLVRVLSIRVTEKEYLMFHKYVKKNFSRAGTLLRKKLLSFLNNNGFDVKALMEENDLAIKQRQIHNVKFRFKKFWMDNYDFQRSHCLNTGELNHKCFLGELNILVEWCNSLPINLKELIKTDMDGLKKYRDVREFERRFRYLMEYGKKLLAFNKK